MSKQRDETGGQNRGARQGSSREAVWDGRRGGSREELRKKAGAGDLNVTPGKVRDRGQ